MTKEEIIEMAEKCGIKLITDEDGHIGFLPRKIYDFAKLIAEKEREECAKECEIVQEINEEKGNWFWEAKNCAFNIRARGQE